MVCNIDKLLAAREEINAVAPKGADGKPAYKLSVNDFVIKALALALQHVPDTNVSWTEAGMLKHMHSDVGIATATPTSECMCFNIPASVQLTFVSGTCCKASASALMTKSLTESLYAGLLSVPFGATALISSRATSSLSILQSIVR